MNKHLLSLLACPICKGKLTHSGGSSLKCGFCKKTYRIVRGVPVLVDLDNLPEHLQRQIRYFNPLSKTYGTKEAKGAWQQKYEDVLFKSMRALKNKLLVDDACGSGYMSIEAATRGMTVLACDLNLSGLIKLNEYAKKQKFSGNILPVCCSAELLPIKTGVADAIVANAILEHLPKEQDAIADITRIAKKGAVAMITVPIAYYLLNPLFLAINYVHDQRIGHLRRYTKEILMKRFFGWKLLNVYYSGHTRKVAKILINMIVKVFDEQKIEEEDQKYSDSKLFASNISVLVKKD